MESFEDKLNKRKEEIAKAEQVRKEREEKEWDEQEAEMIRLKTLLERFKARDVLVLVNDKVWKTGQIKEVAKYNRLQGSHIALELSTSYWDIVDDIYDYETGPDLFGRKGYRVGRGEKVGKREVSISVGVGTTINPDSRYTRRPPLFVDYVDLTYRGCSYEAISPQSSKQKPHFEVFNKRISIESGDLTISKFIEESLIEFTNHKLSPANLEAIGEQRILKASPFSLKGYGEYHKHIRSKKV